MKYIQEKRLRRIRRHRRIRAGVKGTGQKPRLSVFRSNKHIWVQLIDDTTGRTLCAAGDFEVGPTSKKLKVKSKSGTSRALTRILRGEAVGGLVAKRAIERGIKQVVFDRGGYKYHGIIKSVAEGVRKEGVRV